MEICNVKLESNGWTFEVWTDVIRTNLNRQLKWTIQGICNSKNTFGEEDATSKYTDNLTGQIVLDH